MSRHLGVHGRCLLPGAMGIALFGTLGCQRPLIVTQPAAVIVDTAQTRQQHTHVTQAPRRYADFWAAIANIDVPAAHTHASNDEQRQFALALAAMADGRTSVAESLVTPLLAARDTLVRRAARLTYGAALAARADWPRLATFANAFPPPSTPPDAAGVETWATVFAETRTRTTFTDSIAVLPLLRTPTGAPVVTVDVNGVPKRFWLDTGSSISIVSSSVATECGIAPMNGDTLELLTAVGRIPGQPAVIRSLRAGNAQVNDTPTMIVSTNALTITGGVQNARVTAIDGIVGFDVIRRLDLTIDDVNGRVIVRQPEPRTDDPLRPRNLIWFGVPIVSARSERGAVVHFSLDTGAEETYATPSFLKKTRVHAVAAERRTVYGFGGGKAERGYVIPRVRLEVGDTRIVLQRIFLYDARYPTIFELDGTLGADLGRGAVIRIDMTNGRFDVAGP